MINRTTKIFSILVFSVLLIVCMIPFSSTVYGQTDDISKEEAEITTTENKAESSETDNKEDSEEVKDFVISINPVEPEIQHPRTISINGGSSDYSEAEPGTVVTITADSSEKDQIFDHWEFYTESTRPENINSPVTTFIMPNDDVSIWAIFSDKAPEKNPDNKASDKRIADKNPSDSSTDAASISEREKPQSQVAETAVKQAPPANRAVKAPLTGDRNRILTLVIIIIAAILALLILMTKKRNRK